MSPLILSVITAIGFLILATLTYGLEAYLAHAWVAMVFWGLLGAGASVFILSREGVRGG